MDREGPNDVIRTGPNRSMEHTGVETPAEMPGRFWEACGGTAGAPGIVRDVIPARIGTAGDGR